MDPLTAHPLAFEFWNPPSLQPTVPPSDHQIFGWFSLHVQQAIEGTHWNMSQLESIMAPSPLQLHTFKLEHAQLTPSGLASLAHVLRGVVALDKLSLKGIGRSEEDYSFAYQVLFETVARSSLTSLDVSHYCALDDASAAALADAI
ncbi:Aste57867_2148 [Aphanomyces stellatus]|uniref:Aste57867_2148 protein n=1 Tax=Aphanomyces stellatus TaxID=120398 RepID=A0A485KB76_9STRA|nr:hypothetical protein As57867_002143 [Aphanomyces stellatus]VFT79351.1 Aste57867_2148 [Aphanomyces stellatus]